jgi:CO/xanthine dehydrogenase FAD-binding subunit
MPQLKGYHRPGNIDEALALLARPNINSTVIAGGTHIIPNLSDAVDEVIDLQNVAGLAQVKQVGHQLILGAMVRLQTLVEAGQMPALLRAAASLEGPNTLRHAATIGGVVAAPHKESELLAALLVFEAEVEVQSGGGRKTVALPNFLRDIPSALNGGIITAVALTTTGKTAHARTARTPTDRPIVAALARLADDGQMRLALCGVANTPVLIDPANVKAGVNPPGDFRGSREYRRQLAATLSQRVITEIAEQN